MQQRHGSSYQADGSMQQGHGRPYQGIIFASDALFYWMEHKNRLNDQKE